MNKRQPNETFKRKWSQRVTESSDALDLEKGVFTWNDPYKIALSLKNSAVASQHRKGTAYQSAVSMLNFYINRAGRNLPETRRLVLEKAKRELKIIFGREEHHARS
jgi:uncharacterized protein DUF3175